MISYRVFIKSVGKTFKMFPSLPIFSMPRFFILFIYYENISGQIKGFEIYSRHFFKVVDGRCIMFTCSSAILISFSLISTKILCIKFLTPRHRSSTKHFILCVSKKIYTIKIEISLNYFRKHEMERKDIFFFLDFEGFLPHVF